MSKAETVLGAVAAHVGRTLDARRGDPVAPVIDEVCLGERLERYDFARPRPLDVVVEDLTDLLRRFAVRSDHPRYFGLFNPPSLLPAIAGDMIAAAINPQLAVWSHAPAASEIESRLVRLFGGCVWPEAEVVGTFTSGGSEANATALLAALARNDPSWEREGLPRTGPRPAIFASAESHLAWVKIARGCGLGAQAVRLVPAAGGLRLSAQALAHAIEQDPNWSPVLVVATAGTTAHGEIDDLAGIAAVGQLHNAHVHVDAAWAGGALLHPDRRRLFAGIEQADSVTIDPHKWLAVPMGAGLFLARDRAPLAAAFAVSTGYMPSATQQRHDPYIHSIQWSRRCIGLKLFAALATLGLDGYRALIDHAFELADRLRARLRGDGWLLSNQTALPLVCFAPATGGDERVRAIEAAVVASGAAWISSVRLSGKLVLRACITSFETTEEDLEVLLDALRTARGE